MIVSQLPIISYLSNDIWALNKVSLIIANRSLLHSLERWNNECILTQLVSECLLGLVLGAELLELARWLLLLHGEALNILASKMSLLEVVLNVSVEFPDIDAVTFADTDDLRVVPWIEHDAVDWVSVTDEALEVVRNGLLCFVVPNLDHAILSCSEEIA